jgi:hypothetical protein
MRLLKVVAALRGTDERNIYLYTRIKERRLCEGYKKKRKHVNAQRHRLPVFSSGTASRRCCPPPPPLASAAVSLSLQKTIMWH